jgi:hypothetical protein
LKEARVQQDFHQVMGNKMNKNADRKEIKGGELRRNDSKEKGV